MNDADLFEAIRDATAIGSRTPLADVLIRGERLQRRRRLAAVGTVGATALAAVAVVAVAVMVPLLAHNSASPNPKATTPPSAPGSAATPSTSLVWKTDVAPSGTITVRLGSADALSQPATAAALEEALISEGVPVVIRTGPQSCAYQVITDPGIVAAVATVVPVNAQNSGPSSTPTPTSASTSAAPPSDYVTGPGPSGTSTAIPPNGPGAPAASTASSAGDSSSARLTFVIVPSALPKGTTLQIWADNPDAGAGLFSILPAGPPHC
jgi:hypothetical protein